ncbi:MAG: hypothetical protein P8O15_00290 [Luminiphilus sp.]|nr:hypothetical protein [Luminiphilus sp.]
MRSALIALALFYIEVVSAACPTTFVNDGGWHTSDPEWSADVIYVITTFSLSNDASGDVDFSALTAPETLQRWVNYPVGGDPYITPVYDIPDASLTFKTSPAGNVYASGATITWQVAMDISGAPAGYQNTLSVRPEEGGSYGQFSYTLLSSSISCSSGEPFFAAIAAAEAGVDEISLTVAAEAGSATITSYDAICEDTDGNETGAVSTGTTISVADLENGEDYTCTVTASNSIGTSIASGPAEISTPSSRLPVWLMYKAAE